MKQRTTSFLQRLALLATCLLILFAIALSKNGLILGHEIQLSENEISLDTATVTQFNDGLVVINTSRLCHDIQGYAGPTPLKIYVRNNIVDSIEVLPNQETPDFFACVEEELFCQYLGKSVKELTQTEIDAVTGATFSSEAVKANMQQGMSLVPDSVPVQTDSKEAFTFNWKVALALLISLMAAILPLFFKNKSYRIIQLSLNVIILGLYTGSFVSYSTLTSIFSHGFSWSMIVVIFLMVVALLYPLFGRRGYYCAWCCPLGSAQDLAGRVQKRKLSLSPITIKWLDRFRKSLWAMLMLLTWTGIWLDWMDYELFIGFVWQSASWVIIGFLILTLVLSLFVNRPYCRFVCPTGTMLKML